MADLSVRDGVLHVRFTGPEKFWGLIRDLDVPVEKVTKVGRVQQWREVRGLRVGTALPRVWLAGRWYWRHRRHGLAAGRSKELADIRSRRAARREKREPRATFPETLMRHALRQARRGPLELRCLRALGRRGMWFGRRAGDRRRGDGRPGGE